MTLNRLLRWTIGALGLALTVLPAFFVFYGRLDLQRHQLFMLIGMVMWFSVAPSIMGRKREATQ